MSTEDLVSAYGAAIDAKRACLLIGAGLSRGGGFPLWGELVAKAAAKAEVPKTEDYPLWAQYIEDAPGGADALLEEIVRNIAEVEPEPTENHRLLVGLPITDLWTTNYDAMIETAGPELSVVSQDQDLVVSEVGDRRVYKMHGSIPFGAKSPVGGRDQLVITRNDYERYADTTHPRMWRLLQAQFLTSSFLFLGFSFDDPNFGDMLKMVRRAISGGPMMSHYALMRRPDGDSGLFDARVRNLAFQGVKVVEISDYNEITAVLRRLVARTLPMRLLVSGSARTPSQPPWASGSYPTEATPDHLDGLAQGLGAALADADIPGMLAAGDVGARIGYAYLQALKSYDPARFVLLRRRNDDQDLTPPSKRLGEIRLADSEPSQLRDRAFESVRCVLVVGGGKGTLDEVRRAREAGMSVIPLASTGGAAEQIWNEMWDSLTSHEIGQQAIPNGPFKGLADADTSVAIAAAVELVARGLFMA